MAILNYSTTIEPERTAAEIQRILASHGAKSILIQYGQGGQVVALAFTIPTPYGERPFRLPVHPEPIFKVLTGQYRQGKVPRRFVTREQAARVAWRIVRDWIAAQMALLESEMVSLEEIMLPYLQVDASRTLYEAMAESRLQLPAAEGEGR